MSSSAIATSGTRVLTACAAACSFLATTMMMVTVGSDGMDIESRYTHAQLAVENPHRFRGVQPSDAIAPHMYLTPLAKWKAVCQHLAMTRDVARLDTDVTADGAKRWSSAERAAYVTASAIALCKHAVVSIDDLMVRRCFMLSAARPLTPCVMRHPSDRHQGKDSSKREIQPTQSCQVGLLQRSHGRYVPRRACLSTRTQHVHCSAALQTRGCSLWRTPTSVIKATAPTSPCSLCFKSCTICTATTWMEFAPCWTEATGNGS